MLSSLSRQAPATLSALRMLHRFGAWMRGLAAGIAFCWRAQRRMAQDRRILMAMNAHELNDIGLGRGEVPHLTADEMFERHHGWRSW